MHSVQLLYHSVFAMWKSCRASLFEGTVSVNKVASLNTANLPFHTDSFSPSVSVATGM